MKDVKLHLLILLTSIIICLSTDETKQKEIAILEKKKSDLLKQIHTAIDDSVSLLKKDNNVQNVQGINYMLELKQQMQKLNETEVQNTKLMEEDTSSELENRRRMRNSKNQNIDRQLNYNFMTTLGDEFNINKVLFGKKVSAERLKHMMETRQAMQKKLDEWILQREIEKAKIREHYLAKKKLLLAGLVEKCPRFGSVQNKRVKRRHNDENLSNSSETDIFGKDKPLRKTKKGKKGKAYPCCRKCCKKSYLGCL